MWTDTCLKLAVPAHAMLPFLIAVKDSVYSSTHTLTNPRTDPDESTSRLLLALLLPILSPVVDGIDCVDSILVL
jgi:hypothetical protein